MWNTRLQFLEDTFLYETSTVILDSGEAEGFPYIITESTVFYPGGGGQESDKGAVLTAQGDKWPVLKAQKKAQAIWHFLSPETDMKALSENKRVRVLIDKDHRLLNARLHTAGHLLSALVYEKLRWPWKPVKGFHYQQGAYIEFDPMADGPEQAQTLLNDVLAEAMCQPQPITTTVVTPEDPAFASAFKPEGFIPPEGQPLRLVQIGTYQAIPCGGTHLHHTGELNMVRIKQIKHKKGRIRLSYEAG